jgi:ubiquinone/menaquinone biosynthesis C-methylase UbiE
MPNGLALATLLLIAALVLSYVITLLLSLILSPSHTKRRELKELMKKLDLKEGDVFADLGCGDGRVLFEVAKTFKGVKCIGYEISPIQLMIANLSKLLACPFSRRVVIIPQDFTRADLSNIDVFYINWGKNITPRFKELKGELEKKKNVKVVEA